MKITTKEIALTVEQRIAINDKLSYLASSGQLTKTLSREEIFNFYSGKGGLHGLQFKDYDCFHNYTKAKQELEMGAFFTPDSLFEKIHKQLKIKKNYLVADLTFGKGGFFNGIEIEGNVFGCEFDSLNYQIASALFPGASLSNKDIRNFSITEKMDVVFGNPPFNLRWRYEKEDTSSQFVYIQKSFDSLKHNGILVLLVPSYYLMDEMIHKNDRSYIDKRFIIKCQYKLPVKTFATAGVSNYETKIMVLQKENTEENFVNDYNSFIDLPTDEDLFHTEFIAPLYKKLDSSKSKLLNGVNDSKSGFEARVKKLLFDIRRNPKTVEFYARCFAYYEQYLNQVQPEKMDYKEWEKIKITAPKVVRYLRQHLAKQHPKKVHKTGTLIKGHHCLKEVRVKDSKISINELIVGDVIYPYKDEKYLPLILKKRRWVKKQMQSYDSMSLDKPILKFLKELKLKGFDNGEVVDITLDTLSPKTRCLKFETSKNDLFVNHNIKAYDWTEYRYSIQLLDTNKVLQKKLLLFTMGARKW